MKGLLLIVIKKSVLSKSGQWWALGRRQMLVSFYQKLQRGRLERRLRLVPVPEKEQVQASPYCGHDMTWVRNLTRRQKRSLGLSVVRRVRAHHGPLSTCIR